tara:strand:- start:538 stop:849 length:312 start_codon:yes stop_codon:yes gene_type:complete
MKFPDIIGSSDKKFRNYDYGKRPGKKLVKYSPVKAQFNKLKNISLKKGVMKGIKFTAKAAFSPIGLSLAGGALAVAGVKKAMGEKPIKRPKQKTFNRKGMSVL